MNKERYFNFPIMLLQDFLIDYEKVLVNIRDYALYSHSEKLELGTAIDKFKSSAIFFKLILGNNKKSLENGKKLYYSIAPNVPKVGVNLTIWWDYYKNYKGDFEKVCLLGFLALKSILQQKAYCKITNEFWFGRMDGKAKSCPYNELSEPLHKYANEYQAKKIKTELRLNWNLIAYGRHTRGFYVSFNLSLERISISSRKAKEINPREAIKNQREGIIGKGY